MTPERWQQIDQLFKAALACERPQREELLSVKCAGDEPLRREVESLLSSLEEADDFIEVPAGDVAAELLGTHQAALEPGQQIENYRIVRPLGSGGMAEVYLAEDIRLKRKVALKLLPPHFTANRDRVLRFEQEARAASALNHPNIITIYQIGEANSTLMIATEFVEGETLRQRLATGALNLNEALHFAIQIADALATAHKAGIIHRDIKPENVMIRPDGYVKVLDFGLAKLTEHASLMSIAEAPTKQVKTGSGMIMGTVGYMSPEQTRGKEVDARSDIFNLGAVIYEMVSGQKPFDGETPSDIVAAILKTDPPALSHSAPQAPPELVRIVAKALRKDREERYQTIGDLRIDLKTLAREIDFADHQRNSSASKRIMSEASSSFDSLAVLPFSTSDSNPDSEYLSDGITEAVINTLAQLPQLKVMARSTVFRYKDQNRDPREIGRDLHVKAVLTGKVTQHGDNLIVSAELVDVADGSQLWGEHYKRHMTDIFQVQKEISSEISDKLRLKLTREQQEKLTRCYTDNAEAYRLYLKGRYWWNKRTIDGMKKAVLYFEQAIELDPTYALAYAGLADCYAMLGLYTALAPDESFPKAKIAQLRALEIDDNLAEARASLGFTLMFHDWDLKQAERELRRAIELNPGFASAHQWLGFCLGFGRRTEEAMAEMNLALQLDPFSASINYTAAIPIFWRRRYDEAILLFRSAVELHPDFWSTHYWLGLALAQNGEFALAIAELEKARALGDSPWSLSGLGYAYARAGRKNDAQEILNELKALAKETYVSAYEIALVYAGLDKANEAFDYLERAFDNRDRMMIWLGVHPLFDNLRADTRFRDLLLRIGLTDPQNT